jgi:hypothetical protein
MTPRTCTTLLATLALAATVPSEARAHGSDYAVSVDMGVSGGVTFDTFHGPLSTYGDWVTVGSYGRAWRPHVAAGWRPYYYGRWEWTNEGWLWVSDEPWGWAAYHYGRWAHDPYYGWVWVPGYEWAPAWVSWRTSGDVIGWAPLAPGLSVYVTTYPFVDFWWTFVPTVRFVSVPVYSVAYAPGHTRRWYRNTAPAPARPAPRGTVGRPVPAAAPAWGGPAPRLIAERTGRAPTPVRIVATPAPGARAARAGEIPVYRPESRPPPGRGVGGGPAAIRGGNAAPSTTPAPGRGREDDRASSRAIAPESRGAAGAASRAAPSEGRGPAVAPPARGSAPARGAAGAASRAAPPEGRGPAAAPPTRPPPPAPEARGEGRREERGSVQGAAPALRSPPAGASSPAPAPRGGSPGGGGGREERGAPPPRR